MPFQGYALTKRLCATECVRVHVYIYIYIYIYMIHRECMIPLSVCVHVHI